MTKDLIKRICLSEELPEKARCLVMRKQDIIAANKEEECKTYYYIENSDIKTYRHSSVIEKEIKEMPLSYATLRSLRCDANAIEVRE